MKLGKPLAVGFAEEAEEAEETVAAVPRVEPAARAGVAVPEGEAVPAAR
ncbi:hypothetical protein ACIHFE_04485 [Streptomyces sp. NPDC052396]